MKHALAIIICFFSVQLWCQNFQGVATYKTKRKIDIKMDSTQIASDMQEKMMEMLKKQFEKTYLLTFNKEESIYKEDEALSSPQPGSSSGIMVSVSGGSDLLYKNTKQQRFTNQNEIMGKVFLIKDSLNTINWKLEKETKNIGEYTCFKATTTRTDTMQLNGEQKETKEVTITAWYTPQIPVNNGPSMYHGLPGLILEANHGSEVIVCSKIVLNPDDKTTISEPSKGKEVSQKEFDIIMEKKMKEMEEQFSSSRDSDGNTIQIRIGG